MLEARSTILIAWVAVLASLLVADPVSAQRLVRDINTATADSNPANLTVVGGTLFFTVLDPETGVELWKSDGTAEGTTLVADINPGSANSYPLDLTG
jgi:ELWxxDGT repeat protein